MLRAYSEKAKNNIRQYIIDHFDCTNYDIEEPKDFPETARVIWEIFNKEYPQRGRETKQDRFISWCQGLPSLLDTCYYYNRSAVDDLATLLEMTEQEKAKWVRKGDSDRDIDWNYAKEIEAGHRISSLMFFAIRDAAIGYNK